MTVLVGVRCKDGVVIGADSATTSGDASGALNTTNPGNKLDVIDGSIIIAHTGQLGMGQRFRDIVSNGWKNKNYSSLSPLDVVRQMAQQGLIDFQKTGASKNSYGALVGFPNKSGPQLCEFAISDFQPEMKEDLFFCSMGSGQLVVDPFLGLFRKAFWHGGPPNLEDGVFAVTWALQLAIDLCPVGVAGPIRIATLKNSKASFVEKEELEEHQQNIDGVISYLGNYRAALSQASDTAPEVPKP